MATSGLLFVTMQPRPALALNDFHDWYNNEHGPNRLRLPFITTGYRYKSIDNQKPEWMAMYDITDMSFLEQGVYTRLRKAPVQSQRERDTMKNIDIVRKFFDYKDARFSSSEQISDPSTGNTIIVWYMQLDGRQLAVDQLWELSAIKEIQQKKNWTRTRIFATSSLEATAPTEIVAIHDFSGASQSDGQSEQQLNSIAESISSGSSRAYQLYYTFGPAPRDIASPTKDIQFPDGRTKVTHDSSSQTNSVESYITTSDGIDLVYRLVGSSDAHAPLIVLVNSILVNWQIWNGFIQSFCANVSNQKYRFLLMNSRGRNANTGTELVTIDVLARDIIDALDALKVETAHAVVGVSLGGVTSLNVALKHPQRLRSFVACDTNAVAPAANPKAWQERIEIAEADQQSNESNESIVGEKLAELTTRRWFIEQSYKDDVKSKTINEVKTIVQSNSLEGFKGAVKALYQYDLRSEMSSGTVPGLFLVGSGDGVLPSTMQEMAKQYGRGDSSFVKVDGAGHLPMVEQPDQFAAAITAFLQKV